jgi:hypothetical protein
MVLTAPDKERLSYVTLLETTLAQYGEFTNLSIRIRGL